VLVYNKLDLLSDEERSELLVGKRDAVGVSAATGEGVPELLDAIATAFESTLKPMELLFPYDEGAALSDLHAIAGKLEREDTADGVRVSASVPAALAHRFEPYATPNGSGGSANGSQAA
jgi:GTP-binding protein HflX